MLIIFLPNVAERRNKTNRKPNAAGRIQDAAFRLFYAQGYENTGLQEILDQSQTAKSVLYHHYRGKDELRDLYLKDRIGRMEDYFIQLSKAPTLERFVKRWAALARAEARMSHYRGCAIANLRAELPPENAPDVQPMMKSYVESLERLLSRAIQKYQPQTSAAEGRRMSGRLLGAYYGALQLYRLNGSPGYLKELDTTFQFIIKADQN